MGLGGWGRFKEEAARVILGDGKALRRVGGEGGKGEGKMGEGEEEGREGVNDGEEWGGSGIGG